MRPAWASTCARLQHGRLGTPSGARPSFCAHPSNGAKKAKTKCCPFAPKLRMRSAFILQIRRPAYHEERGKSGRAAGDSPCEPAKRHESERNATCAERGETRWAGAHRAAQCVCGVALRGDARRRRGARSAAHPRPASSPRCEAAPASFARNASEAQVSQRVLALMQASMRSRAEREAATTSRCGRCRMHAHCPPTRWRTKRRKREHARPR